MQTSVVHWLPSSAGASLLSTALTTPPEPLHWLFWQSPGVWDATGVPAAVKDIRQACAEQVRCWHSLSVPVHCDAVLQGTQAETPSQKAPPFWLHAVLIALAGWDGTPAL